MNHAKPDYYDVGLKDAREHLEYIRYKPTRTKTLADPPRALVATLDNEANLAQTTRKRHMQRKSGVERWKDQC